MNNKGFDLTGRVALVTGSTTGLGKAMAIALGKAGAKVALNYANNQERAEKALAEFKAAGCEGALFRASVVDEAEVKRLVEEVAKTLGPIDILVFNATRISRKSRSRSMTGRFTSPCWIFSSRVRSCSRVRACRI